MNNFADRVRAFITKQQLFNHGDRLLLAVSGGLDSMVMAHFFLTEGYTCIIAHVNYQLRGEASEGDFNFVKNWALSRDAKFVSLTVDTLKAKAKGQSTQMAARNIRYMYFGEILDEYNLDHILTAHHLDDQLETTLINFIRGTGLRGLSSLPAREGRRRRPLLVVTRAEIQAYAADNGIQWREDSTNTEDGYLRNRVRHQLTPLLQELGLTMSGYARTTNHLKFSRKMYEDRIAEIQLKIVRYSDGITRVAMDGIDPSINRVHLLNELSLPGNFTEEEFRQIIEADSPITLVSETHVLQWDGSTVSFRRIPEVTRPGGEEIRIETLPAEFTSNGSRYSISVADRMGNLNQASVHFLSPTSVDYNPAEQTVKLTLRSRLPGDRLQPLGMGGRSRKLKDIFNDFKVSAPLRQGYTVVVNDGGDILCIPELMVSEVGKVRETDQRVIAIRLQKKMPDSNKSRTS